MGTGGWLLLPERDKWMDVGNWKRPVAGCWHRMWTGGWLLLPDRDE